MYASYVGHDTVVNLLLDAKADPNKGTPEGLTPLMVAAGCGNESVCFFLIQVHRYTLYTFLSHYTLELNQTRPARLQISESMNATVLNYCDTPTSQLPARFGCVRT